jgi:hypothetical protein
VALSPSIAVAQKELARQGMCLDKKAVRRIAEQLGTQMLALRQRELLAWRAGALPAGKDFRGKRVVVQFDGGRIRMRENKPRRKQRRKGEREKFDTPWREPKVVTIFEIDAQGKLTKKHQQPLIDGTLLGPDHVAELAAYHLHRLGVAEAELVVFVSDGAHWIWDRLEWSGVPGWIRHGQYMCWISVTRRITSVWHYKPLVGTKPCGVKPMAGYARC